MIRFAIFRVGAFLGGVISAGSGLGAAPATIANAVSEATVWRDVDGNELVNFCGNLLLVDGTYYWYGWDKYSHTGNVYTSTTLGSNSWRKLTGPRFPLFGEGFHGRPDVIYHRGNKTYVMIVEYSSKVGRNGIEYLTSPSPAGPFTSVLKEDRVLGDVSMGDKGIFQDEDGTAYLLCDTDDGGNNNGTNKIVRLKANYLGQEEVMASWTVANKRREALSIVRRGDTYYLTSSATSGWKSSATQYKTAKNLRGPWSDWQVLATVPSSTNSFNTQHDFIFKIVGSKETAFFYAGDRWSRDTQVGFGRAGWFPVTFDAAGVPTLHGEDTWTLDVKTGVVNVGQK